jgi:hypothetical protein
MRWGLLVWLLPAVAVAGGAGNEGEKLYRDLEKRVVKAKAVRVAFASKMMKGDKEFGHFKGVVDLDEGNKGRVELKGQGDGKEFAMEAVSDGKKLKVTMTPPGKEQEQPLPKDFGVLVRTSLSRAGPVASLLFARPMVPGEDPGPDQFPVSDFKLGANAKVAGREARVIEYKVSPKGGDTVSVKLWLDAKTHLPLKRDLSAEKGGESFRIVETYSEFKLGSKGAGLEPLKPSTGTGAK